MADITQLDPDGSYTYADYLSWQFTELVELIRGKIMRRMSAPTDLHQVVAGELYRRIANLLHRQPCQMRQAPYGVRLLTRGTAAEPVSTAIRTVVQPDVCVICDPAKIEPRGCLGAPDFIIEVTSPGTIARDWKAKYDLYEENGVAEYWIVMSGEALISVFVLNLATARYGLVGEYAGPGPVPCATLPGVGLDWADVFAAAEGP